VSRLRTLHASDNCARALCGHLSFMLATKTHALARMVAESTAASPAQAKKKNKSLG
jgi:hypothetical protein